MTLYKTATKEITVFNWIPFWIFYLRIESPEFYRPPFLARQITTNLFYISASLINTTTVSTKKRAVPIKEINKRRKEKQSKKKQKRIFQCLCREYLTTRETDKSRAPTAYKFRERDGCDEKFCPAAAKLLRTSGSLTRRAAVNFFRCSYHSDNRLSAMRRLRGRVNRRRCSTVLINLVERQDYCAIDQKVPERNGFASRPFNARVSASVQHGRSTSTSTGTTVSSFSFASRTTTPIRLIKPATRTCVTG